MKYRNASCHKLIAETAKAMALEAADEALGLSNPLFKKLKEKYPEKSRGELLKLLAGKTWPSLIPQARATLAKMLTGPLDQGLKDQISSALILDNTLPGRRPRARAGI